MALLVLQPEEISLRILESLDDDSVLAAIHASPALRRVFFKNEFSLCYKILAKKIKPLLPKICSHVQITNNMYKLGVGKAPADSDQCQPCRDYLGFKKMETICLKTTLRFFIFERDLELMDPTAREVVTKTLWPVVSHHLEHSPCRGLF